MPLRVSRALVETDLIVTVTAAETVLHGGPASLLKLRRETLRAAGATSLLETGTSQGWSLALVLERLLSARTPIFGVVARAQPAERLRRLPVRGADPRAARDLAAAPRLRAASRAGAAAIVERVPRELTAAAVFGGTPSSAHAEALLRAIEFKGAASTSRSTRS